MSYNGSGTFNINSAGQPVVTGTVISSTAFNALTADLGTGLSTAITKDGQTVATARIPFAAGINSSLVTDATSTTTGSIITAGGVGIAKALFVGTTANIAGTTTLAGVTATSITDSGLTAGRVTYAGSAGLLQDSANLTFSGSALAVTGTLSATTTAAVAAVTINGTHATGGTFFLVQRSGVAKSYFGSSASISTVGTANDTDIYAVGDGRLFGGDQTTNFTKFTSTGLAVTGTLSATGVLSATGNLTSLTAQFGTNPAGVSVGVIGISNQKRIYGRNAANTADVNILYVDASNNVVFGPSDMASFSSTGLAVTGTLSATGTITSTTLSGAVLHGVGGTTGNQYLDMNNTSGQLLAGVESSAGGSIVSGSAAYSAILGTNQARSLHLYTNNTIGVTLDTSGNLLVGTTTAVEKLTVGGNISINAGSGNPYLQIKTAGAGNNPFVRLQADTLTWDIQGAFSNVGDELYFNFGGANRSYINSSTGAYVAVSDQRLKKDITDISYGLSAVMALRPVEYLMNTEADDAQKHLGFIAQEAQAVIPNSVSEMTGGMYGMDKTEIVPVLVKAIQEQQAIITALTTRITALETK